MNIHLLKLNFWKKKFGPFSIIAFLIFFGSYDIYAQSCTGSGIPLSYDIVQVNATDCKIQINWGASMPEIQCGSPGTPTGTVSGQLFKLSVISNGSTYTIYDRGSGSSCNSPVSTDLEYGSDPNTHISTIANMDFCLAGSDNEEGTITITGNQSGGASFGPCTIPNVNSLPVEFSSLHAKPMLRSNMLEWTTASEENTLLFSIEKRSNNNKSWKPLGEVRAAGFSSTLQEYSFEDKEPSALNYYRVKSVDFDGYQEYSEVIALQRKDLMNLKFEVYPNPVVDQLTLDFAADIEGPANFTFSDFSGQVIEQQRLQMQKGINKIQLDASDLNAGMYFVSLEHKSGVYAQKISVIKEK